MTGAEVLFSEDEIRSRVEDIAAQIKQDFEGKNLCVIGLLEDSFVFMADLIRKVDGEVLCYFMKADVAEDDDRVTRVKKILYSPEFDSRDRNILLVGGVLDTGITLDYVMKHLLQGGPALLKICYLIDKPALRRISISPDYSAFCVEGGTAGHWVGYGLGFQDRFRNLPFLGALS